MGLHKAIETPEKMLFYFNQYKKWVVENPIQIEDYVGKDANRVLREKPRPLTMEGFEDWLFQENIIGSVDQYFTNQEERYNDFVDICRAIRRSIRKDQIEGGMAGIYNPSITQRLNGLVDKTEAKIQMEAPLFGEVNE